MTVHIDGLMHARTLVERHLGSTVSAQVARSLHGLSDAELHAAVDAGDLIAVLVDGDLRFPTEQFLGHKKRHNDLVRIAHEAFDPLDPTGTLAASWLLAFMSPAGFKWRDLNAYRSDDALAVARMLARLDAARCQASTAR